MCRPGNTDKNFLAHLNDRMHMSLGKCGQRSEDGLAKVRRFSFKK